MKIVHVIQRLSRGGAARSMLAQIKYTQRLGSFEHVILSLVTPEPAALELARNLNTRVIDASASNDLLRDTDLIQVHFWNTPELYAWLDANKLPARILLTLPIGGDAPAQFITRAVLEYADFVVANSAYTLELPALQSVPANHRALLLTVADSEQFVSVSMQSHSNFNIGYIGTVDFVKMHPRYVELSAKANTPDGKFVVAGSGDGFRTLERQARALHVSDRFEWHGYVNDPRPILETLDLFGYPLRADNYSASDLALQEAMLAGIPAVILPYGGTARLIQHNETGWIARDEDEYPRALDYLYENPNERKRLGENAASYAREFFDAERAARDLCKVYETVCAMPKQVHELRHQSLSQYAGANAFVESLGEYGGDFLSSLRDGAEAMRAEEKIAAASPVLVDGAAGGVLAYRRFYPNDAFLALWSGLVLEHAGRFALAAAEYQRAQTLGLTQARIGGYFARCQRMSAAKNAANE